MTSFNDITVKPDTAKIDCFRYLSDNGSPAAFSVVQTDDASYYLRGAAESQLFKFLNLSIEGITNLPWDQRANVIKEAFTKPFILKCADEFPYAVVTTSYTTVRHKVAWGWAQDMLNQNMINAELMGTLSTDRKLFARFHTYKDFTKDRYSTYNSGFFIINSVRGAGSLGFGQSVYIPEEEAYLTGPVLHSFAHAGELSDIESNFKSLFISSFLSFSMPLWELLKGAPKQGLMAQVDELLYKYKRAIKRRLNEGSSLYDAIVVIADIALVAPAKTRLELERLAYQGAFHE